MDIVGLMWLGTRTDQFEQTTTFFAELMGLERIPTEGHFAVFRLPDGSTVEVFGAQSPFNTHIEHPVGGFFVADLTVAERELGDNGIEIVLPRQGDQERSWLHFRAPDGFVYALTQVAPGA